jgi:hypothetical protein
VAVLVDPASGLCEALEGLEGFGAELADSAELAASVEAEPVSGS